MATGMEALMQYVWEHRLLPYSGLKTTDGRKVRVINPGQLNHGAGPDFFNAVIEIDDVHWAGNVEIHVRASDWHRHGHDGDPAYENVILHVVDRSDTTIELKAGHTIPQILMPCDPALHDYYLQMVNSPMRDLACAEELKELPEIYRHDWISALGMKRLISKAERVQDIMRQKNDDWEEACYITLARGLGFGTNAEPFERLAKATPLHVLRRHADNIENVEAILMGQSGLLSRSPIDDDYGIKLRANYNFFRHKFPINPLESVIWKAGRPTNSPQRRIAFLAKFVSQNRGFFSQMMEIKTIDDARALFSSARADGYWEDHFSIGVKSPRVLGWLSEDSITLLIINVLVPLLMARGNDTGESALCERAIALLEQLPAEKNRLVNNFAAADLIPQNAYESQALVELCRNYCELHKCLYCRFGHRFLSHHALRLT